MKLIASFLTILLPLLAQTTSGADKTLAEIRKELMGQEVIITGTKGPTLDRRKSEDVFLHWEIAEKDGQGVFKAKRDSKFMRTYAPYNLKGAKGVVVAVEVADNPLEGRKSNPSKDLFGDPIGDKNIVNPLINVVVKLGDGVLLINRTYFTLLRSELQLASEAEKLKQDISENLDSLIGKTIYPVAWSTIFPPDAELDQINDLMRSKQLRLRDVPNLTPLLISKAKYIENENSILLKVEFLGGRTGIIFSKYYENRGTNDAPFIQRAASSFLAALPKELSSEEIEAVKNGTLFKGMSLSALHHSIGFSSKQNDWGIGGQQLFYGDRMFVYIQDKKVVDWQILSR